MIYRRALVALIGAGVDSARLNPRTEVPGDVWWQHLSPMIYRRALVALIGTVVVCARLNPRAEVPGELLATRSNRLDALPIGHRVEK